MKNKNNAVILFSLIVFFIGAVIGSCGKLDDTYRQFLEGGETIYVAKADSLKVQSGRERVQLSWLFPADPKVKKYKVYWGNRSDSIENNLDVSGDSDTIKLVIDNLSGGVYEFEVFQYSDDGATSVRSAVIGRAYDHNYENYLPNRVVESAIRMETGETTIRWTKYNNPDMLGIEFSYISLSNQKIDIVIPPENLETIIQDVKADSEITYRTMFKPDSAAIDTFYSRYDTFVPETFVLKGDITEYILKNYKVPFGRLDNWDGSRWGIVSDWTVSESAKINCKDGNCYGSWDGHKSVRENTMSVQRWTNDPAAPNAKIYQTIVLPAGEYEFSLKLVESLTNTGSNPRYIIVNKGNSLPDVDNLGSALAFKSFVGTSIKVATTTFTLTENTEVSLGILFHFIDPQQVFNVESFKLVKN